jgi:hypothetical protein
VGWLVGMLAGKEWAQYHRPRATLALGAVGAPVLALLQILPAVWLGVPILAQAWQGLGYASLYSALAVVALEAGAYFFEHPIPLPKLPVRRALSNQPAVPPPAPMPPADLPPIEPDDRTDDLIMLELD